MLIAYIGSSKHIPDLPISTSAIYYQPNKAKLAALTAQIDVLVEEVSLKPSDNVPLLEELVNGSKIDEYLVDKDLFKLLTTPADFYLVGKPPVDNSLDIGYNSADNIQGPKTEDNVNKLEAPIKELDGIQGNDRNIAQNIVKLVIFYRLSAKELTNLISEEPFIIIFKLINKKVFKLA